MANYNAFKVDGKTMYVFDEDNPPEWVFKFTKYKAVEIVRTNYSERKKYKELEEKIKELKKKGKTLL